MNKVILAMNDPIRCLNCPLSWYKHMGGWFCGMEHGEENGVPIYKSIDIGSKARPDWCPLKPAPELIKVNYGSDEQDWEKGYNRCLHEIIGD